MSEKKIGRYEIKRELGRGGMATVYLAYDPVLERDVALKLLPNYFAHDPEFSARFEREAKTVAALEHGSIVSMYDYGEDGEWPYFVMRLMKGGSLKDRIEKGEMSLEDASRIVSRVAGALDKAHSKDIVHRDLKPGNIMFDEDGAAYLGDFGIVKLAESSESYTRTGNTLGTPAYMSPEQADGNPDIDGRSDIYSLGIILYEMLTGTAPYTHESMPRLLIMHLTAPIPNVLAARPDLPASIQAVIEKAMAKERDDRYATAGELADAVAAVLDGTAAAVLTKAAPAIEIEPETAVAATPTTQPTTQPTIQPAPAKSGGMPKWIYAVIGVVVIGVIGAIALAGGGDGNSAVVDNEAQIAAAAPTESLPEATAVPAEPTTPPEATAVPTAVAVQEPVADNTVSEAGFNYFDNPKGWSTAGLIESDEFDISNGQATFVTRIEGASWIVYDEILGDGTYSIDVMMPDAEPLTTGFGLILLYDDVREDWYEFYLDSDGRASANACSARCDDFKSVLHNAESRGVNTKVGAVNTLSVTIDGSSMIFYVNDEKVGSTTDRALEDGSIGLILFTDIEQDLKVVFDNFTFTPAP